MAALLPMANAASELVIPRSLELGLCSVSGVSVEMEWNGRTPELPDLRNVARKPFT